MNERDQEFAVQAGVGDTWNKADWYSISPEMLEKFADLIRADERARLERSIAELAPVVSNPILQNKPAAFWIESFTQIVRGNT